MPHTKITFTFSAADTQAGLAGSVTDKSTGAAILFESKRDGDYLSARISDGTGGALVEYVEVERAPVTDPVTAAARSFGAKRREATKDLKPAREAEPLHADSVDCEQLQCVFADTHDYQLSEQGGYVVKSLSPRLVLSHNFASREVRNGDGHSDHEYARAARRKGAGADFIKAVFGAKPVGGAMPLVAAARRDDESQVNECFGRCGAGCGGWGHSWVGEPTVMANFTYCEPPDPNGWAPDCSTFRCSIERQVVSYSGIAVHATSGKVTLGAKAHDTCCRDLGGPCWLLSLGPCAPALALAADCGIPGAGAEHTWSYIGPHAEGYDYYTGNCCVAIGPIA